MSELAERGAASERGAGLASEGERRAGLAAIIVAGGGSTRMGTDKLALRIDGVSVLERAIAACSIAERIIVAGAPRELSSGTPEVTFVQEDPPHGGPAAGVAAALSALAEGVDVSGQTGHPEEERTGQAAEAPIEEVLVLAADLVRPDVVVTRLLAEQLPAEGDSCQGLALIDEERVTQYLAGRYRRAALTAALGSPAQARGRRVHALLGSLTLALVPAEAGEADDLDTPTQATDAGAVLPD